MGQPIVIETILKGHREVAAGLKSIAGGLTGLIAGAAGIGTLAEGLRRTVELGGHMTDLSARTGESIAKLTVFRQVLNDTGVGAESAGTALSMMQRRLIEAAESGGEAEGALREVGLAAEDLIRKSPVDQFRGIADGLQRIEDPAKRAALAMQIFGRGGAELLPLLTDAGAFQEAEQALGRLPAMLQRNAANLDAIGDRIGRLKTQALGFFVGFADGFSRDVAGKLESLNEIDLTGAGQRVAAFFRIIAEAARDGSLGEVIGLSIEAGFELGIAKGKAILSAFFETVTTVQFSQAYSRIVFSLIDQAGRGLIELGSSVRVFVGAMAFEIADLIRFVFEKEFSIIKSLGGAAINLIAERLEDLINKAGGIANRIFGTDFKPQFLPRVDTGSTDVKGPIAFADAMAKAYEANKTVTDKFQAAWSKAVGAVREFVGVTDAATESTNEQGTAAERLRKRVDELVDKMEQLNTQTLPASTVTAYQTRFNLEDAQHKLSAALLELEERRAIVTGSWFVSAVEKFRTNNTLLQEEKRLLSDQIALLEQKALLEHDPQRRNQIENAAQGARDRLSGVNRDLATQPADPESFSEQIRSKVQTLRDEIGTTAQQLGRAFDGIARGSINSIAAGLKGIWKGTMDWKETLQSISGGVFDAVIDAISRMFAEWIVNRVLLSGVERTQGAIDAAAKAPGALMSSISSYGAAAYAGIAALLAGIAALSGAFADGGLITGASGGPRDDNVIARVSRGEYVNSAATVDSFGVDFFDSIKSGSVTPSNLTDYAAAKYGNTSHRGKTGPEVMVAVFDSEPSARKFVRSKEFDAAFVDTARRTRRPGGRG